VSRELRPAVFLDRDGVINYNRHDYVKSWSEFELLPHSLAALRRLASTNIPIVVVTNQSAVRRGLISPFELYDIHARMTWIVRAHGGRINRIFHCPHLPSDACSCRKPEIGLLTKAAQTMNIDLRRSYLVGDAMSDVHAGLRAGCRSLLVLTGRGAQAQRSLSGGDGIDDRSRAAVEVVPDLPAAVEWIIGHIAAR
jgi:D-glycero-D-manno-heptose 1,7-bisphosphate phosphatase